MTWDEKLQLFDNLVEQCPRFERKGKSMIYTSANGYMFALLNKAGEIGIRFSEAVKAQYIEAFETSIYKSYGAVMKGYVLIPDRMLDDSETIVNLLNESYDYVMSLPPK